MVADIDLEGQQTLDNSTSNGKSEVEDSNHVEATGNDFVASGISNRGYSPLKNLRAIFCRQSTDPRLGMPSCVDKSLDEYAQGYPHLGAFLALDQDFLIFRRFGYLQARVLLNMQDQLREYEEKLHSLEEDPGCEIWRRQSREANSGECKELLRKIEDKFERYVTLMNNVSRFSLREAPSEASFKALRNYFDKNAPIIAKEMHYRYKDDLITVFPSEDTAVDRFLGKFLHSDLGNIKLRIFGDAERSRRYPGMVIYNPNRLLALKAVCLGFPLMILLVSPIIPLYRLSQGETTGVALVGIMLIQLTFTCIFACCLKCLTRPKRHELYACSVAYMGVLIVFMSQTIQSSHSEDITPSG
ncbi:hypothetical protein F4804DRAFT_347756 [Jackrogersella minutella]|nr:hypothetical protein F4804DRAFT_347756 [Jackrogersella minutella]